MQKIFNKIIIIVFFLTTACASSWDDIKKGLGGEKRKTTDEFLVKKKEPLNMPPRWEELPRPGATQNSNTNESTEDVTDIEELIQLGKNQETSESLEESDGDLEESVLRRIKKN